MIRAYLPRVVQRKLAFLLSYHSQVIGPIGGFRNDNRKVVREVSLVKTHES
jgi:hypothetical protein